jgi:hypothetical protein
MLDWIFRKKKDIGAGPAPRGAPTEPMAQVQAQAPKPQVDWEAALVQARGNDEALLTLARKAGTPLQIKQGAVEALQGEAALRVAEREFRRHDRRVHQLAKQRLQAQESQRQAREQATRLIDSARSLAGLAMLPVNRVVELDQAWQALEPGAIEPAQREEFAALSTQLGLQLRQRADIELKRKRWRSDATAAVQQLQAACTEAAAGTLDRERLAAAISAASDVERLLPPDGETDPAQVRLVDELRQGIQLASLLAGHLDVLARLLAGSGVVPATELYAATPSMTESIDDALRDWQALAPLGDPRLAELIQTRHARWQQARTEALQARQAQRREQARERQRALKGQQVMALADCITLAETALDAGQLGDAHRHLSEIDNQLQGADAPAALQSRIAATQARLAQLRGWQHWAGGRAREELVLQAEALAAATVGDDRSVEGKPEAVDGVAAEVARLSIRQRSELIQTLRKRWKEIDASGGAGSRALWQRFDAALAAAGEPVAAHVAAQRAAREANLAAREQLLEVLEAVGEVEAAEPAALAGSATSLDDVAALEPNDESPALDAPVDARRLAAALDRFHAEWRKLGPPEHTVPRAAREALAERMEAVLRRLEVPLRAARELATVRRQALVARARALLGDAASRGRDLVGEVRSLQFEWQQQAKALPLARADEQALWTEFKTAIDAAFAAREAAFNARDAEFEAHGAERLALIERLRLRPEDSAASQRRLLAEVDAAWQRCGPAPRARAAALEAEYRAARDVLRQWQDDSERRAWQATCDALEAKLALCLERERRGVEGGDPDATATAQAWSALPVLPGPLEGAMRVRAGLAPAAGGEPAPDTDELLLQIEMAWELPTPPTFESARRTRKLLAMKQSLEGRRPASTQALAPDASMALLLGRANLNATQVDRLVAVLAAFRRQGAKRLS